LIGASSAEKQKAPLKLSRLSSKKVKNEIRIKTVFEEKMFYFEGRINRKIS